MAFPPPTSKISGPPPGGTPQGLTSMVPQGPPPGPPESLGAGGMQPTPPGGGGGLKDVVGELSGMLDSLAEILPEQAEEIDSIKIQLTEVLAKAISGGAAFKGQTEGQPQGRPTPSFPA